MAVDVSKIPNNNKFDPVREAILQLQEDIQAEGQIAYDGEITVGKVTGSTITVTGGSFTVNQATPTTISIGIDDSGYYSTSGGEIDGNVDITGNLVVEGNLTVSGATITKLSEEVLIEDNIIVLNSNEDGTPSLDAGIEIERGTSTNVDFLWNETSNEWDLQTYSGLRVYKFGTGSNTLTIEAGSTAGDAVLALTPNTTGTGGVIQTTNERPIAFQPNSTTKMVIASGGDVNIYDNLAIGKTGSPSYALDVTGDGYFTGDVTATTFIGALQGNADTANWADQVDVNANDTFNGTYSLLWHDGDTVYSSSWLTVKGSTDTLIAPNIALSGVLSVENGQPKLRLKESDTTNVDKELLVSGGTFYIRNLNDDNTNGANIISVDSNSNVTATTFIGDLDGSADQVDGLDATDFTLDYVTDNNSSTTNAITIGGSSVGGGRMLSKTYSGFNRLNVLSSMASSGNLLIGYGLEGAGTANTYLSTYENFSGRHGGIEVYSKGFKYVGDTSNSQTTIGDEITVTTFFNLDSGNLEISGSIDVGGSVDVGGSTAINSSRQLDVTAATVKGLLNLTTTGAELQVGGVEVIDASRNITANSLTTDSISGGTIDINGTTAINLQYNGTTQLRIDSTGVDYLGTVSFSNDGISLTDEDSTIDSFFHANVDYDAGLYTVTSNARYGADYIQVDGLDSREDVSFTISPKDIGDPDPHAYLYIGGDNSITAPNTLVDWHTIEMNALSVQINNNEVATQTWVTNTALGTFDLQDVTDNGNTTTNDIGVGNITSSGLRDIVISSSAGSIRIDGSSGGWSNGYFFNNYSGTFIGGFGAFGGADTLNYFWIGDNYNDASLTIDPSQGDVDIVAGDLQIGGTTVIDSSRNISAAYGTFSDRITITTDKDNKLILQSPSSDTSDWNYIEFKGRDGVRDAFIGTDDDGDFRIYSDKNAKGLGVYSGGTIIDSSLTVNGGSSNAILNMNAAGNSFVEKDNGEHFYFANNAQDKNIYLRVNDGGTYTNAIQIIGSTANVGIGTAPEQKLHINGNLLLQNNNEIRFKDTGATQRTVTRVTSSNELEFGWSGAGAVKFMGGGSYTERMRVHTNGNIGIGTTSPNSKLHIDSGGSSSGLRLTGSNSSYTGAFIANTASGAARIYMDASNGDFGGSDYSWIGQNNDLTFEVSTSPLAGDILFNPAATERMRVTTSGNVGIGTDSPNSKLEVNGQARIVGSMMIGNSATTNVVPSNIQLHIKNSGEAALRLEDTDSDNLAYDFVVNHGQGFYIEETVGGESGDNTVLFAQHTTGNIGISNTSPDEKLHVSGNIKANAFGSESNTYTRVYSPEGATYNGASSNTGMLTVILPQIGLNTMLKMTIRVFDYAEDESFDVQVAGYLYGNPNTYWTRTSAYILASPQKDRNFTVRFGYNSVGKGCVFIGETGSTWSYVKFGVVEAQFSHSQTSLGNWIDGWATTILSDYTGYTFYRTETDTQATNWKRNGQDVYYGSGTGNVGIGAPSPSHKLTVSGDTYLNGKVGIGITPTTTWDLRIRSQYPLALSNSSSVAKFEFYADLNENRYLNGAKIVGYNQDLSIDTTSSSYDILLANNGGNVGIGTTSPDVKFEVIADSPTNGVIADFVNSANAGGTTAAIKLSNADSEACDVILGANRVGANFGSDFFISLSDGTDGTNQERFRITEAGNVGIGTASPYTTLNVVGANSTSDFADYGIVAFENQDEEGLSIGYDTDGNYTYLFSREIGVASRGLRLQGSIFIPSYNNNVGIGTTTPAYKLDVNGDINTRSALLISSSMFVNTSRRSIFLNSFASGGGEGIFFRDGFTYNCSITAEDHNGSSADGICISGYDGVSFSTGSNSRNERMRVASNGNVGIGTTSPAYKLDVRSSGNLFYGQTDLNNTTSVFRLRGNGGSTDLFEVKADGSVGIGTNSPAAKLDIANNNSATSLLIRNGDVSSGSNNEAQIQFGYNGTDDYSHFIRTRHNSDDVGGNAIDFYTCDSTQNNSITSGVRHNLTLDSGNVGIGTTSPSLKLTVNGSAGLMTGTFYANSIAAYSGAMTLGPTGASELKIRTAALERMRITSTGEVGIGTTSPSAKLHILADTTNNQFILERIGTATGKYKFYTNNNSLWIYDEAQTAHRMMINSIGQVGIGTTAPSNKLHVNGGRIQVQNGVSGEIYLRNSSNYVYGDENGVAILAANNNLRLYTAGSNRLHINSSGSVGVGNTNPQFLFHVGGAGARMRVGPYYTSGGDRDFVDLIAHGSDSKVYSNNERFHIQNDSGHIILMPASASSVGIGTTTPSSTYKLDVTGTIRATGDVIAYSDARVKENVKTIDNALDKVTKLRGVEYNKIGETDQKIGVIAQEIEQILPQVVQEDENGMKSVAYGNIVGVLIEAIKEQQKQIDELKARLDGSTK